MCGRFSLITEVQHLLHYFELVTAPPFPGARFNIAPTQDVAAVVAVDGERHLEYFHWGLIPFWARDRKIAASTINARAETVAQKPAFRQPFRRHRCLIPADGFYEWHGRPGHKQVWRIEPQEHQALFAFAGLWDSWEHNGEMVRSCTIIVTEANETIRPVHERMPLVLPREAWDVWLDPTSDLAAVERLLQQPSMPPLRLYRVGSHVNNPRNDDPQCLQPLAET